MCSQKVQQYLKEWDMIISLEKRIKHETHLLFTHNSCCWSNVWSLCLWWHTDTTIRYPLWRNEKYMFPALMLCIRSSSVSCTKETRACMTPNSVASLSSQPYLEHGYTVVSDTFRIQIILIGINRDWTRDFVNYPHSPLGTQNNKNRNYRTNFFHYWQGTLAHEAKWVHNASRVIKIWKEEEKNLKKLRLDIKFGPVYDGRYL